MLIIPAIDLKDGLLMRASAARAAWKIPRYFPTTLLRWRWQTGLTLAHVVCTWWTLNGAFAGEPVNGGIVKAIAEAYPELPIQIGGGIRSFETIQAYLDAGVQYVIIGTKAVKEPEFVFEACKRFPGHIIVGLDAKDGKVAIDGWAEVTDVDVIELAKQFKEAGVSAIVYTDISRDGMMQGVNVEATARLAQECGIDVIASGGVTNIDDVRALAKVADTGICGAITGRAIYEGTLDLSEAQQLSDELTS
ncbi:MAG: 1-(5-phosphoribosyl)-5-[(5-phosphoribosylamino)methylideneamino] imidazole-4-carboxamide isomerase [Pseudomonadales bacterium]